MMSICIPTYNRLPDLKQLLTSIFMGFEGTDYPYEVIIADGGSTDGTLEYLRDLDKIKLIEQGKLIGTVKAVNACLEIAKGDYIFTANDDFVIVPDVLIKCCKFMDREKQIGFVAPKIQEPRYGNLPGVTVKKYWILLSKIGIFRASVLKEINYFDENYRTYYVDDDNFLSVMKLGYTTIFSREVGVIHYRVRDENINEARAINQDDRRVAKDHKHLIQKWFKLEENIEKYLNSYPSKKDRATFFTYICNKIYYSKSLAPIVPRWLYDWFLEKVIIFKDENYRNMNNFYLAQKYPKELIN